MCPSEYSAMVYLEAAWCQGKVPSEYTSLGSYPLIASANDGEAMHPSCVPLLDQYDPAKRKASRSQCVSHACPTVSR